MIRVSL